MLSVAITTVPQQAFLSQQQHPTFLPKEKERTRARSLLLSTASFTRRVEVDHVLFSLDAREQYAEAYC